MFGVPWYMSSGSGSCDIDPQEKGWAFWAFIGILTIFLWKLLINQIKAQEKHKAILGHLMYVVSVIAKEQKLEEGFRVVINNGKNGGLFIIIIIIIEKYIFFYKNTHFFIFII